MRDRARNNKRGRITGRAVAACHIWWMMPLPVADCSPRRRRVAASLGFAAASLVTAKASVDLGTNPTSDSFVGPRRGVQKRLELLPYWIGSHRTSVRTELAM